MNANIFGRRANCYAKKDERAVERSAFLIFIGMQCPWRRLGARGPGQEAGLGRVPVAPPLVAGPGLEQWPGRGAGENESRPQECPPPAQALLPSTCVAAGQAPTPPGRMRVQGSVGLKMRSLD